MRLCRQDDHPQNTKWCPSHRKITCRASKLERKRKISIVIPMVSESSRVHMSAIPLGEMRRCTFCGSRLRAWYLLVGDPELNLHLPQLLGRGTTQNIPYMDSLGNMKNASWWLNHPHWKILVKLDHWILPRDRGWTSKICSKPPPEMDLWWFLTRMAISFQVCTILYQFH